MKCVLLLIACLALTHGLNLRAQSHMLSEIGTSLEARSRAATYVGYIQVGSIATPIPMIFDTGSSDILLPTQLLTVKGGLPEGYTYPPPCTDQCVKIKAINLNTPAPIFFTSSSSMSMVQPPNGGPNFPAFISTFTTIAYKCAAARDNITLGSLSVSKQAVGLIIQAQPASPSFTLPTVPPGVFGLGMSIQEGNMGTVRSVISDATPFVETLEKQDKLALNQFSFVFSDDEDPVKASVTFGLPSKANFIPPIVSVPLINTNVWEVSLSAVHLGDSHLDICSESKPCFANFDSGFSNFVGPNADVDVINNAINEAYREAGNSLLADPVFVAKKNGAKVTCNDFPDLNEVLPAIFFDMGDYTFTIEPEIYLDKFCASKFMGSTEDLPAGNWYFGRAFMRKYHTTFDRANKRMGFALSMNGKALQAPVAHEDVDEPAEWGDMTIDADDKRVKSQYIALTQLLGNDNYLVMASTSLTRYRRI